MGIYCFPPEFPSLGQGAFVPHIAAITSCTFPVPCIVLYLTCTLSYWATGKLEYSAVYSTFFVAQY